MCFTVDQLTADESRVLLSGLCATAEPLANAHGALVSLSSGSCCDALVRIAVHAGFAAHFEQLPSSRWRLCIVDARESGPIAVESQRGGDSGVSEWQEECLTWCFDSCSAPGANDGFVVVRRVQRGAATKGGNGPIVRVSQPTIQGSKCYREWSC